MDYKSKLDQPMINNRKRSYTIVTEVTRNLRLGNKFVRELLNSNENKENMLNYADVAFFQIWLINIFSYK